MYSLVILDGNVDLKMVRHQSVPRRVRWVSLRGARVEKNDPLLEMVRNPDSLGRTLE